MDLEHCCQCPEWLYRGLERAVLGAILGETVTSSIRELFRQEPIHRLNNSLVPAISILSEPPHPVAGSTHAWFDALRPPSAGCAVCSVHSVALELVCY